MCNPIKIFECTITNALSESLGINISRYVQPETSRENLPSELMPSNLLTKNERGIVISAGYRNFKYVNEEMRSHLTLRDSDRNIKNIGTKKHKS